MKYEEIALLAEKIKQNIQQVLVGRDTQIELAITALLVGGHVLLEDVPGTGKTTLAKAMAKSLDCTFSRVQFTPDLLPADISGMRVWQQHTGEFVFLKGPVFCNILVADEINRATPRTQSALLECMEEKQVTEGGTTYALDAPFFVIATQNPVETQGTFPLPEAQLDRFLVRLSMGYPTREETITMLKRFNGKAPLNDLKPVAEVCDLNEAHRLYTDCHISDAVLSYIADLCEAARNPEQVKLGPSPRAELMLMLASQAFAAIHGRDYVIPDDVKALAVPVLAHRMILRGMMKQNSSDFLMELLSTVPSPTEAAL